MLTMHSESSGKEEMESRDNYFIGVTLPEELKTVIDGARGWMQKKWGNRSGMKTECHITLVPPFSCDKTLSEMKKILDGVTVPQVDVSVRGWGSFGRRTIYAHVEHSSPLELLKEEIEKRLRENLIRFKRDKRFMPHITIANRDIKPESFMPSMEYLHDIELDETFTVDSFMIFSFIDWSWRSGEKGRVSFSS